MVLTRTCTFCKHDGVRCQSAPVRGGEFCFWHSPDHSDEATEARRFGGLRRKRERNDGILATFPAASQAIAAALSVGNAVKVAGLELHVALHAGDVIHEQDNVFGGTVNIAALISALARPGEVLVSDVVRALARMSAASSSRSAANTRSREWRTRSGCMRSGAGDDRRIPPSCVALRGCFPAEPEWVFWRLKACSP